MKKIILLFLMTVLLFSACGTSQEGIEVSNVWARMGDAGTNSSDAIVTIADCVNSDGIGKQTSGSCGSHTRRRVFNDC